MTQLPYEVDPIKKKAYEETFIYGGDELEVRIGKTQSIIPLQERRCPCGYVFKLANGEIVVKTLGIPGGGTRVTSRNRRLKPVGFLIFHRFEHCFSTGLRREMTVSHPDIYPRFHRLQT